MREPSETIEVMISRLKSNHNEKVKQLQNNCRNQYNRIVRSRNNYYTKRNLINNIFAYYRKTLEYLKKELQNRIQELYNSIYSNSESDSDSDSRFSIQFRFNLRGWTSLLVRLPTCQEEKYKLLQV